jgi:hypothetical protein
VAARFIFRIPVSNGGYFARIASVKATHSTAATSKMPQVAH